MSLLLSSYRPVVAGFGPCRGNIGSRGWYSAMGPSVQFRRRTEITVLRCNGDEMRDRELWTEARDKCARKYPGEIWDMGRAPWNHWDDVLGAWPIARQGTVREKRWLVCEFGKAHRARFRCS